ncbi:MAG: YgcG family protein [Solimonas sp.]
MLLFASLAALADVPVPALTARVTDQTGTLDASQRAALESKLAAFEQAKGSQIALLIVPTTEPETIEQYSIRVAEQWKLGRKGVDDGLLILVARNDRALRIEVGYGLEGAVPDAIANRVIDEIIVPKFRSGDYYGGLDAGVDQLIKVIDGEPLPAPPQRSAAQRGGKLESLLPVLFLALIAAQLLRRVFGQGLGSLLAGGAVFGLVWLLSGLLAVAALFGLAAFVLTLFGAALPFGGGGWSSRGGGFGGGWGGGGFGGGGGGFGGGGASGRW